VQRRSLLRSIAASGVGLPVVTGVGADRARSGDGYAPIGRQHVDGAAEVVVDEDGTTTYVAADTGFAVVDAADPADPTVLTEVRDVAADREDGPLTSILDLAVDGDRLLVSGPAAAGELAGLVVYDVSDPADPVAATEFYETGFDVHNASLADGYAYLTNNRPLWRPLTVVDVSRDSPEELARWSPREYDPGVEGWTDRVGLPWSLHDVTVRGDHAYCSYWDAGTWILDVSDPASPSFVSRVGPYTIEEVVELADSEGDELFETSMQAPGNDHSAALDEAGDLLAVGGEGWDVRDPDPGGPPGIRLYDVSDVAAPRRLATIDAPRVEDDGLDGTWVSAHNFDLAEGRLFSAWYQAGVKVHDVTDPSNPALLAW